MSFSTTWVRRSSIGLLIVGAMFGAEGHATTVLDAYRTGTAYDDFDPSPDGVGDSGVGGPMGVTVGQRGIALFDFASLTGPVADAQLVLYIDENRWGSSVSRTLGVTGRGGNGTIEAGDYALGEAAGSFAYTGSFLPVLIDVTGFLNSFLATPNFIRCAGLLPGETCDLMMQVAWPAGGELLTDDFVRFERASIQITERSSVPEPGSLALLGFGLAGTVLVRRRKAH